MKVIKILLTFLLLATGSSQAQELFVFTEPASNMPAKSIGIRASNWVMHEQSVNLINYHFIPEIMWGANKNLMLHAEGFLSNRDGMLKGEGGAVYGKYRFYSRDEVFKHFRMAVYGRLSANNGDIHQEEIETNGHNSGYESGLIATQLLHKVALSASLSYEKALNNLNGNDFPKNFSSEAMDYTFSIGKLMLPKVYTDFKQVNVNFMLEFLGQTQLQKAKSYMDIAPSIQLIFNSQTRIDLAYRQELYSDMLRTAPNGFLIRIEHLLFNVF
jgi:hypothetical protein